MIEHRLLVLLKYQYNESVKFRIVCSRHDYTIG